MREGCCHFSLLQRSHRRKFRSSIGCKNRTVETIPLAVGPETRWTVDLEPGAYELDVFAYYESGGASGDVSGSLGLTVAGAKQWDALHVSPVEPSMWVCSSG